MEHLAMMEQVIGPIPPSLAGVAVEGVRHLFKRSVPAASVQGPSLCGFSCLPEPRPCRPGRCHCRGRASAWPSKGQRSEAVVTARALVQRALWPTLASPWLTASHPSASPTPWPALQQQAQLAGGGGEQEEPEGCAGKQQQQQRPPPPPLPPDRKGPLPCCLCSITRTRFSVAAWSALDTLTPCCCPISYG